MGLESSFIPGFEKAAQDLGLEVKREDHQRIARDDKRYLSLVVSRENYGLAQVTFADVTVVLGNVSKALESNVLEVEPSGNV